jgi:hypothetical protein
MEDEKKHSLTRRDLLGAAGLACAAGVLGSVARAAAGEEHGAHHTGRKGVAAVMVDATREGVCGTCRFWGGIRRVSEDRKVVHAESLGWCNNVESPHFQTMRTPEAGPMKAWRKWEAL